MSAPAGWHLQPDGRERFWDGTRWTDQFRTTTPPDLSDPTAPPTETGWSSAPGGYGDADPTSSSDPTAESSGTVPDIVPEQTQALDVSSTQALPTYPPQPTADSATTAPASSDHPPSEYYAYPPGAGSPPAGYGAPGYGAPGYGAPGGQQWQPPQKSGNGLLKGCLIAGAVLAVVLAVVVGAAIYLFARTAETVSENFPTTFPTDLPSGFPTELPSGVPTEGLEDQIQLDVGGEFRLPRATIAQGWSLEQQGAGVPIVNITGMKATLSDDNGFPVIFTMSFGEGNDRVETVCTAPSGASGATVDVTCVPLFGDVADARRVTVTASL